MAKVEFTRILGIADGHEFLPLAAAGMLVECATGSAALFSPKSNSFSVFTVELKRGGLVTCGAVVEIKFHVVIKFYHAIVAYAAANGAESCPKGRGAWGGEHQSTECRCRERL